MLAWEAIQTTLNYIEIHYEERLEVEQLAQIAHLSRYYFQRLFYRLVGKSVIDYVRLRRLAHAAQQLKTQQDTILDIAIACGFSSHSHFTRVFQDTYGITPQDYRRSDVTLDHIIKPELSLSYTLVDPGVSLIMDGMVLEIQTQILQEDVMFIGNSTLASMEELGEPKINHLIELWKDFPEDQERIGVDILTPDEDPTKFQYFVGLEGSKAIADQEIRVMPKGTYVVCSYEAENFELLVKEALYRASAYLYDIWLPQHGMKPGNLLVQKYLHPFEENCSIELWANIL